MTAKIQTLRAAKPADARPDLEDVVKRLRVSRDVTHNIRQGGKIRELPSSGTVMDVVDGLVTSLFPTHLGPTGLKSDGVDNFVSNTLYTATTRLTDEVRRGLQFDAENLLSAEAKRSAQEIVNSSALELPNIAPRW